VQAARITAGTRKKSVIDKREKRAYRARACGIRTSLEHPDGQPPEYSRSRPLLRARVCLGLSKSQDLPRRRAGGLGI